MAPYIAYHNPNMSANDCITESRKMMDGHKMRLFSLHLSFIGWYILSIFTFGILLLWIFPKVRYAEYLFYLDVSGKGKEAYQFDGDNSEEF
jgi:uncharacterized membrane protein